MKKALITGITGQDGNYLAEFRLPGTYRAVIMVWLRPRLPFLLRSFSDHIRRRQSCAGPMIWSALSIEHQFCSL